MYMRTVRFEFANVHAAGQLQKLVPRLNHTLRVTKRHEFCILFLQSLIFFTKHRRPLCYTVSSFSCEIVWANLLLVFTFQKSNDYENVGPNPVNMADKYFLSKNIQTLFHSCIIKSVQTSHHTFLWRPSHTSLLNTIVYWKLIFLKCKLRSTNFHSSLSSGLKI